MLGGEYRSPKYTDHEHGLLTTLAGPSAHYHRDAASIVSSVRFAETLAVAITTKPILLRILFTGFLQESSRKE
jgi:hypothetical protein